MTFNFSHSASVASAKSMVSSNSGLSCFDYPLDRNNRDTVCAHLTNLNYKIIAVWVCGRPVVGNSPNSFEHWAVKIQAPPALISIDFLEYNKKGSFSLQQCSASNAQLIDFLHYYIKDQQQRHRRKWKILSSVTPHPLTNKIYWPHLDNDDIEQLKLYSKNAKKAVKKPFKYFKNIDCDRKVCDISDFIAMWTSEQASVKARANAYVLHQKNKKHNGRGSSRRQRPYNAITSNCQQFAADLFDFLVGHQYPKKAQLLKSKVQSPFDMKVYEEDISVKEREAKVVVNREVR